MNGHFHNQFMRSRASKRADEIVLAMGRSLSPTMDAKSARWWTWATYLTIFFCLLLLTVRYALNSELQTISSEEFWRQSRIRAYNHTSSHHQAAVHSKDQTGYLFPKVVHQTWKSKSVPPHQTLRWRTGCKALNPRYEFNMFDDDDLMSFTLKHYPKYGTVLQELTGVYMADMARVILAYHFGGIYMDLDFYCHRPMSCLEHYALQVLATHLESVAPHLTRSLLIQHRVNILLVPREPLMHAYFLHGRPRVVIQDFYMSTAKHPFMQWLLDDLSTSYINHNYTLTSKGPLSYSIDQMLDQYYSFRKLTKIPAAVHSGRTSLAYSSDECGALFKDALKGDVPGPDGLNTSNVRTKLRSNGRGSCEFIIEVDEDILHPLLDASNHHLSERCAKIDSWKPSNTAKYSNLIDNSTQSFLSESQRVALQKHCQRLGSGKYLAPSLAQTVLVHMWTHSFLDWSFLRGWYDQGTYVNVERTLPATETCPSTWNV